MEANPNPNPILNITLTLTLTPFKFRFKKTLKKIGNKKPKKKLLKISMERILMKWGSYEER